MKNIQLLKENGIDVDKGIELLGDIEMYDETLQDFLEEMKSRVSLIEEYKNKKDMENYAILVHALKGDCNYLGFTTLAQLSLEHQLKSQDSDIKYVEDHYDQLKKEIVRIIEVINDYLDR